MDTPPPILTVNWFPRSEPEAAGKQGHLVGMLPQTCHHKGRGDGVALSCPQVLGLGFQERADIKASQPVLAHGCSLLQ